ncbi:transcriptional regulator [Hwanghaeella grinnelliae]|uniref:Transcriptional regulator n=1 Tax=Hwanghaeella grinnelliae TaxID=2500179 RepID=A0A437QPU4_9PROT|nr:helix-turn-helix domain-containing protein [Hwanghaeella grinnelliae]RVU36479.1 transcriptional regulator [Hwanghaeella grinnelliae]
MTSQNRTNCPIKRATDTLGDQWSFLILREFFLEGPRRFADLQDQLGLSPNTLSGRLKKLEQAGIVERRMYSEHPPRAEYALTEKGRTLSPVMDALFDWGMTHAPM